MIREVKFESQDRRINQILAALNENGIKDIEEANAICEQYGLDPYMTCEETQPICFENAKWAYVVGTAIALKKGCKTAAEAAEAMPEEYAEETAAEEDETLLQQVERVELASISTIHAFCLQLIGRYFEKVGAEPGARTCTEAERIILQQRAMDAVLDEMYSDDERMALLEKMGSPDQVRFNAECLHRFLMCQPDPAGWLENSLAQYSAEKGQLCETAWFRHAASAEGADITWVLAHARAALRFCLCSFSEP